MPRPRNPVPSYRHHKQSGQAIVTLNVNGVRKDMLLGVYDSPESKEEYRRVLTNLEAGRYAAAAAPADLTVNELCARFWKHAQEYYRPGPDEKEASELIDFRYAIREFRGYAGDMPAREFGPIAYKALRERMVKKGWARPTINRQCGRVKRIVRWAVENELLPADRWESLRSVPGLSAGRTNAGEPEPVGPVDEAHYRAVLPLVTDRVRALLEVLEVTGMRPGEACRIRPCDIDTGAAVWCTAPRTTRRSGGGRRGRSRSANVRRRCSPRSPRPTRGSSTSRPRGRAGIRHRTRSRRGSAAGRGGRRAAAVGSTSRTRSPSRSVVRARGSELPTGIPTNCGTCSRPVCATPTTWKRRRFCWVTHGPT